MGHSTLHKRIDVYSMSTQHLFILIELVTSIIIIISCLLVHFRQHFRLQCINRHYTQPQIVSRATLRLSKRLSGPQSPNTEVSQFPERVPTARSSIFSKQTLAHPEDAIQWCLRSIDDQEFDFFPRSFLWYQLFLLCLSSIILYRFLYTDNPHSLNDMYALVIRPIHTNIDLLFTRSPLLSHHKSPPIDWCIIYGVLILTNWEALFVFYRYYSTTYTAKHFNTINTIRVLKPFTVYAIGFLLLFVAQIHFYYYLFPFIILLMATFTIFCSYKTSHILINQFKQMEQMLENFGSNRQIQRTMSKSVYFMRNSSMLSSICCILYLSVLLISYSMCIVYYLPCIWCIVCILCTLNFIRNRHFFTKIFCCKCICKSDKHKPNKSQPETAEKRSVQGDNSNQTNTTITAGDNVTGSDTEMVSSRNNTSNDTDPKTISNELHYQKRPSKSGTDTTIMTNTKPVTIYQDIDENKAYSRAYESVFPPLGALQDNPEDTTTDDEEYDMNETGTTRIYDALNREPTPGDVELNMDHPMKLIMTHEVSVSLDRRASPPRNLNKNVSKLLVDRRRNNRITTKAKSHDPPCTNTSTEFAKSQSETYHKPSVGFKLDNHLAPVKKTQPPKHRRIQSERPHSVAEEPHRVQRSPSVSKSVEPIGRPSIEGHVGNNSDPVKGSSQWQQRNSEKNAHIKSMSFQTGDGNKKHKSRRTVSRRLMFSKLPRQMQILPEVGKHKVEEFANLNHLMTLHGFCEKNQFFEFEVHDR
eukprot:202536_1